MHIFEIIVPCHFGMEAVLKNEIIELGYDVSRVDDGRVTFKGDSEAVVRANIFLRTAERVLIQAACFKAETFEELFEGTKAAQWEDFIPEDGKFWVAKASSVRSKLFSPSDIQSIVKKAIVKRLGEHYGVSWFKEDGEAYPLRVFIKKDEVTIGLDTTGESLHKRGYRRFTAKAPIAENLAAGLLMLTPWKKDRVLIDPFCGSGTFPIEAALMACNIAPGMNRSFTAEGWTNFIDKKLWYRALDEANDLIAMPRALDIIGSDIDPEMIKTARENAKLAGVAELIRFEVKSAADISHDGKYGFVVTNPPYGERILEKEELPKLYSDFGKAFSLLDSWSAYIITSYENVERDMGLKASKNRKIYNGMMKTYFYQFIGPRPVDFKGNQAAFEIVPDKKPQGVRLAQKGELSGKRKFSANNNAKSISRSDLKRDRGRDSMKVESKSQQTGRPKKRWTME